MLKCWTDVEKLLACFQGNETEIIISRYEDHFLVSADGVVFYVFMVIVLTFLTAYQVIATQIGTMGTIVYARSACDFCEISLILFIFLDQ